LAGVGAKLAITDLYKPIVDLTMLSIIGITSNVKPFLYKPKGV